MAPATRSAAALAARFEVSTRTVERDLSALQQAGVPIYATAGRTGGYAIDSQHTLPPLNLSAAEVAAIATALAVDALHASGTPFTQAGRSALQKILAVLREVDADAARDLASRIRLYGGAPGTPRPPAVIEHAMLQRRVLGLDYVDRDGQPSRRDVEPVALLGIHPNWYLWGWCRMRDAPRVFRLDRIGGAVMYDEIAPDRGLDPADIEVGDLIGRGILGT